MFTGAGVEEGKRARDAGARGLLCSRSRPTRACRSTRRSRSRYHEAIAQGVGLPMVAFQLQPALGGVIFCEDTLKQIAAIDNVVALKEASFDARLYLQTAAHDREAAAAASTCSRATTTSSSSRS